MHEARAETPMAEIVIPSLALEFVWKTDHPGAGSAFQPLAMQEIGDHSAARVVPYIGRGPTLGAAWL